MHDISQTEVTTAPDKIEQAISHYGLLTQYVARVLKDGIDYGIIRGTKKPTLYKAGAEKLIQLFNLRPEFTLVDKVQDWTGEAHGMKEPLFFYSYRCVLHFPKVCGNPVGEGSGSCNSLEAKYRGSNWRFELVNTIYKMAQKRALVAAVLVTCGASEYFTQDLETWEQTISGAVDSKEKETAIATVGELITNLGWSIDQAKRYLKNHYGVVGRKQLSLSQLTELIERLEAERL